MNRFAGLMPANEIEIEKFYKDENNFKVIIQAGKNGWTIIWCDKSTYFKDETKSVEENFEEAYKEAMLHVNKLIEIEDNNINIIGEV